MFSVEFIEPYESEMQYQEDMVDAFIANLDLKVQESITREEVREMLFSHRPTSSPSYKLEEGEEAVHDEVPF